MYIIEYEQVQGFAIISADARIPPVLAQSETNAWGGGDTLPGVRDWIGNLKVLMIFALLIRLNGGCASSQYGIVGNCNTATLPGNINNAFSTLGFSNGGTWNDYNASTRSTVFWELRNNRPVIFSGTTCVLFAGAAHIWVADGIHTETFRWWDAWYDEIAMSCPKSEISSQSGTPPAADE